MIRILVLGSAAGGGVPQWNCHCPICQAARTGEVSPRTQSSIAVSSDGDTWFLLNASPDLRQQVTEQSALHPRRGVRHSPIGGVILTNADVDHIAGLLTTRESSPLNLWATPRILDTLSRNRIFDVLKPEYVTRLEMELDDPFPLVAPDGTDSGLVVTPFAVPGKVALYLEDEGSGNFGTVEEDTIGLHVAEPSSGKAFFHIPGCAAMPAPLQDRLRGAQLVLFDGTVWFDDEMARARAGQKTGTRMGHMFMSGPGGSMEAFSNLGVARKVYVHINNTNPVLFPRSQERARAESAGWEIAHDGMELLV
ncbi:MAG: pyrroloquinoline quinone biosynthesis protein PqqB [Myxococcota bacterium]